MATTHLKQLGQAIKTSGLNMRVLEERSATNQVKQQHDNKRIKNKNKVFRALKLLNRRLKMTRSKNNGTSLK